MLFAMVVSNTLDIEAVEDLMSGLSTLGLLRVVLVECANSAKHDAVVDVY